MFLPSNSSSPRNFEITAAVPVASGAVAAAMILNNAVLIPIPARPRVAAIPMVAFPTK